MVEADAPKGSMYFHFPGGKEQLAAAAIDRFAERVTSRTDEGLRAAGTVAEAVAGFFDDYIEHLGRTNFAEGCAVASVALDAAADHERLAEATGRALRTWTDHIAQALEAEGNDPEDAHRLATLVIAVLEGCIVMGKGQRSTEPFAAVRDLIVGLLARPARRSLN
jgi:TetR/AcrR family transcriptional repressor of lmrAB and yxaGH operons